MSTRLDLPQTVTRLDLPQTVTQLDLSQTVTQYLTYDKVDNLFRQMGGDLTRYSLTPNEYKGKVQVITWAVLERLTASNSFPASQLTEDNVKPIVDSAIKDMCKICSEQTLSTPDPTPPGLHSRATWWCLKLLGRELEF